MALLCIKILPFSRILFELCLFHANFVRLKQIDFECYEDEVLYFIHIMFVSHSVLF